MSIENQDEDIYVFFVYGNIPEFMPTMTYRRPKHFKVVKKKIINCPYCGNAYKIIDETAKIEVYRLSQKKKITYHDKTDPCKICHKRAGIIYASA